MLRWPSRKAQERFRAHIRQRLGPPGRLRECWKEVMGGLRAYLVGWGQYYRRGESTRVMASPDRFVCERVARHVARAQPKGKRRRRRQWRYYVQWLGERAVLPRLVHLQQGTLRAYRTPVNVLWRAV